MNAAKIFNNAKWIVVCKVAQSLIQLIVGMISARYLGPSNYGLISYASSLVAFALPFMQLGMAETLVQEYIVNPEREGEILGSALVVNLLSSFACIIGVVSFSAVVHAGERETVLVCLLYSLTLSFQAFEMIKYWYESKLLSKYSAIAMLIGHISVSIYKIYLLVTEKSVYWFALSHAVEYCVVGAILLVTYLLQSGGKIAYSRKCALDMFSRSKHYIIASLMVVVFQSVDHVMLKLMVGDSENGFYTAAITCTVVVSFVYSAIIDSARPVILESKQQSQSMFEKNVSRLYCVIIYMTVLQSLVFSFLAKPIIFVLYGQAYLSAIPILRIIVWQQAFSYMGTLRNIWILAEEKYSILWRINMTGAITNVILNALFIPRWGACGAAFASVLTQIFTNFIMGFILKPIRPNNKLLLKGFDPRLIIELCSIIMRTLKTKN